MRPNMTLPFARKWDAIRLFRNGGSRLLFKKVNKESKTEMLQVRNEPNYATPGIGSGNYEVNTLLIFNC